MFEEAFDLLRLQLISRGKTIEMRIVDAKRRKPQYLLAPTSSLITELQYPTLGLAFYYTSDRNRLRYKAIDQLSSSFRGLMSNYLQQEEEGQLEQLDIGIDKSEDFKTSENNNGLPRFKDEDKNKDKDTVIE